MIYILFLIAFVALWIALNYLFSKMGTWKFDTSKLPSYKKAPEKVTVVEEIKQEEPAPEIVSPNRAGLEVQNLTKVYPSGKEKITAVDIPKLQIKKGEFMAIMGRSGSGKSSLLNLFGGLDKPTSGSVFLDGQDLAKASGGELNQIRNKKIGFVFQEYNLIPTLTAMENVRLPMEYTDTSAEEKDKRALKALSAVGLSDRANHFPSQLSGGENQRVTIARALVNNPTVVLADEPTGEVDTQTSAGIVSLMKDLNKKMGTTFVIVTHDPSLAKSTNRVVTLMDGKISSDRNVVKINTSSPLEEDLL